MNAGDLLLKGLGWLAGKFAGVKRGPRIEPLPTGPAHLYNDFDTCVGCTRYDRQRVRYTTPPCSREHDLS